MISNCGKTLFHLMSQVCQDVINAHKILVYTFVQIFTINTLCTNSNMCKEMDDKHIFIHLPVHSFVNNTGQKKCYAVSVESVLQGHENWVYSIHWMPASCIGMLFQLRFTFFLFWTRFQLCKALVIHLSSKLNEFQDNKTITRNKQMGKCTSRCACCRLPWIRP